MEDKGSSVNGNILDIFYGSHEEALAKGTYTAEVFFSAGLMHDVRKNYQAYEPGNFLPFSGKDSAGTEIITKIQLYMDKSGVISIFFLDNRKKI